MSLHLKGINFHLSHHIGLVNQTTFFMVALRDYTFSNIHDLTLQQYYIPYLAVLNQLLSPIGTYVTDNQLLQI